MENQGLRIINGMNEDNDSILVEKAVRGDELAFAALIGRYHPMVLRTVYRSLGNVSDVEDVVQEVYMRVLLSLKRFNRKYPFRPWILRITHNYCVDQLRRRKAQKHRLWSELTEGEQKKILAKLTYSQEYDVAETSDPLQQLKIALALLDGLKPKHRTAFVLKVLEGHSYESIASIQGVPQSTARVRVSRARAQLYEEYIKHLSAPSGGPGDG